MLVDKAGLWYKVLVARYGEEAGRLMVGGQSGSLWWHETTKIRDGGGWFEECLVTGVGNVAETFYLDGFVVRRSSFVCAVSTPIRLGW